jgi:intraflagellar transport protein 74
MSGSSRQQLQNETVVIRERNEMLQNQLEQIFRDVKSKEMQNSSLEEAISDEKNKANELIHSLSVDDQNKYREYQILCDNLKSENAEIYAKIEDEMKRKEKLSGIVLNSQSRLEAVKLQSKLRETIAKRNQLKDEESNKLSPAQEREKLISEVRLNNQAISGLNKQLKINSEVLSEKRTELMQIEKDLEEGSSERFVKYKELKKRDEMMENFQMTFKDQMKREKQSEFE